MAITTTDGYIAAKKGRVVYQKTASRTSVAAIPFSVFDLAGTPGAGTLAVGNTANGVVPTDATAGYPTLPNPSGTLYLSGVQALNSVACWIYFYDCLFSAGAYAFNASTSLSSQPSYSGRLPNTNEYTNLEIWVEAVTAFTGNPSIAITYTDQDGNTAATTGTVATGAALTVGRMVQMPLASGDSGVQKIESVTATVASAGTFNVHVMRYLTAVRVNAANFGEVQDLFRLGMPKIFGDSAIRMVIVADSTSTGLPAARLTTADG